jgi:ssDNA-binding Zn-finger/Zn-ribbon topoisomerase 1
MSNHNDTMSAQEYAKRLVETLRKVRAGETEIVCPKCRQGTVRVSYTHFGNDKYSTWLECNKCDMVEEAFGHSRPPDFREELINPYFQRLDEETWIRVQAKIKDQATTE